MTAGAPVVNLTTFRTAMLSSLAKLSSKLVRVDELKDVLD